MGMKRDRWRDRENLTAHCSSPYRVRAVIDLDIAERERESD